MKSGQTKMKDSARQGIDTPAATSKKQKRRYSMFDDSFFEDSSSSSSNESSSDGDDDNVSTEDEANVVLKVVADSPATTSTVTTIRLESSQLQTQQSLTVLESQHSSTSPMITPLYQIQSGPDQQDVGAAPLLPSEGPTTAFQTTDISFDLNEKLMKDSGLPSSQTVTRLPSETSCPTDRALVDKDSAANPRPPKVSLSPSSFPKQNRSKPSNKSQNPNLDCIKESRNSNNTIDLTCDTSLAIRNDVSPRSGNEEIKRIRSKNTTQSTKTSSNLNPMTCSDSKPLTSTLNDVQTLQHPRNSEPLATKVAADRAVKKNAKSKKAVQKQMEHHKRDDSKGTPRKEKNAEKSKKIDQKASLKSSKRKAEANCTEELTKVGTLNSPFSAVEIEDATKKKDITNPVNVSQKKRKISFQDKVVSHMMMSFKPCTLKTLATALQTSETTLEYLMLSLVDKNVVLKKEYSTAKGNRTKVLYWANYDVQSKECASLLPATEADQKAARIELEQTQRELVSVNSVLANLLNGPSNVELTIQLREGEDQLLSMKNTWQMMKERIALAVANPSSVFGLNKSSNRAASVPMCPRRLKLRINAMRKEWKNRKDKCMDFVDQLADGMEKKPKDVISLLDIETDEMHKVVMPPLYAVEHEIAKK